MLESEAAFEAAFTVAKARANLTYRYQDALKKSEGQPADQYSLDWLAQLAEGIDPRTAPSKKTFENRLPAKQRTNSYSLDLPIIRDAFPKIAWPDTYRESVQMIAAKQTK
jgi:hypothetical protein